MNRLAIVTAGLLALAAPARAEQPAPPPATAPSPAETNPLPSTTLPDTRGKGPGTAAPTPDKAPVPLPGAGAPPVPAAGPAALPTLAPSSGEANDVDDVTLAAKPAAILSGSAKWETAAGALTASFRKIEEELARRGLKPAGRPISVFTRTEEDGYQNDAMIPVEAVPADAPREGDGVRFGATPSGKALRFKHAGTYDEIDGTYETLVAYLDVKDVKVQERFIEEYVTDLDTGAEAKLDINIYALPQ